MNAIIFLRRITAVLAVLLLVLCMVACGAQKENEWQANRNAENGFSFGTDAGEGEYAYILNRSSGRIHLPNCRYAQTIKEEHRLPVADMQRALTEGYRCCQVCLSNAVQTEE